MNARYKKLIALVLVGSIAMTFSCKKASREMTPEDFLKIEDEIALTDLTPESKEQVVKKYGYTLEQYQSFEEKVRTDKKLQEELGTIRLKSKQQ
ncbi:MAG: hypothetical protein N2316_05895 [Spirochaetes bacterium]|nr:hypothetical protein [Spirochaetota bacterium]